MSAPEEIDQLLARYNNWGRWGPDDERGTLNFVTPDVSLAAMQLARHGDVVSLARRVAPEGPMSGLPPKGASGAPAAPVAPKRLRPAHHPPNTMRFILRSGADAPEAGRGFTADWFGIVCHGFDVTHLDALCHIVWNGRLYNDRPATSFTTTGGAAFGSVEVAGSGVVSRGVLLDIPRHRGIPYLEPTEEIPAAELDACAEAQGVQLRAGDVVIVRTGRDASSYDPAIEGNAGVGADTVPWLHAHDVAMLAADVAQEVLLPGIRTDGVPPVHTVGLVGLGLHLIDNMLLEPLAARCADEGRWEFTFALGPLQLANATGTAVNPLAVF